MISSITIENFRGIENLTVENFGKINVFVGKNNSGKTTLLEALFLMIGVSNPQLALGINSNRDYTDPDETGFSLIYHNFLFENKIKISACLSPKETRTLTITPNYTQPISDSSSKKNDDLLTSSSNLKSAVSGVNYDFSVQHKGQKTNKYSASYIFKSGLIERKFDKNYTEHLLGRTVFPTQINTSLDKNIETLIVEKNMEGLIKALQKVDSRIQKIELGAEGRILCDIGLPKMVPINVMGDGIRKIISIIAALSTVKNGVLLIDELENGLHYSTLKVMWQAIAEASKQYNVQIFVTSHSYECLNALQSTTDEFNVYRIEKHDNSIKTVQFNAEELAGMIENGWEVR